jgi:hypothetical protein
MARMSLDELVNQLQKAYGAELRAVVLYGSAAAGEQFAKLSDTNVLVLVETLDLERLRREAAIARGWAEAGNPPPLTLTVQEWGSSADIFPMEYADILERHRVLYGSPPFEGIVVDRDHLRLEVEQQALGKLLQLRQGVLATESSGRALLELLASRLSTLMVIFRGVVRLHGECPPTDYVALARAVAERAGFDPEPFVKLVRHVRGETKIAEGEAAALLEGILAGAQRVVVHVDAIGKT